MDAMDVLEDEPAVVPDVQRWRDPDKNPPKVEEDVLILFETACGGYGITTANYEDGTVLPKRALSTGKKFPSGEPTIRKR